MKAALVTLSIRPGALYREANKIHKAYALKWGLDHECIEKELIRFRPNLIRKRRVGIHCEKFQMHGLLEHYDRMIYLDSDTLISGSCPNLLDIIPGNKWGCLYEDASPRNWKGLEEIRRLEGRLGRLDGREHRYFNAGVLVCSREHRQVFKPDIHEIFAGRWPEQTTLNYRVIKTGIPVCELDPRYNYLPFFPGWQDDSVRNSQMIIHYAGKDAKASMKKDLPRYLREWGIE